MLSSRVSSHKSRKNYLTWELFVRNSSLHITTITHEHIPLSNLFTIRGTIMASAAQLKANRENSRSSTGPRTEAGKNATKYNAYKHGAYSNIALKPGESLEEWTAFLDDYVEDKAPKGMPQILCVRQAALAEFKLMTMPDFETYQARQDENGYPVDWEEDRLMTDKQTHLLRCEMHLIRARDKHLAQFRLHKKDKADEGEDTHMAKPSRHSASDAATIPVAVQPDPIVDATSPGGTLAAEAASGSPEELGRRQAIREETGEFREYLSTRRYCFSEAEISQEIQDHLIEIGLVVDSPHVEVN